jgi:hypothetical protein
MSLCCPPSQLPHPFSASALCPLCPTLSLLPFLSLSTLLIPCAPSVPLPPPSLPFTLTPLLFFASSPLCTLSWPGVLLQTPLSILANPTAQTPALPHSYHLTTSHPALSSPPALCQPLRLPLPCWFHSFTPQSLLRPLCLSPTLPAGPLKPPHSDPTSLLPALYGPLGPSLTPPHLSLCLATLDTPLLCFLCPLTLTLPLFLTAWLGCSSDPSSP